MTYLEFKNSDNSKYENKNAARLPMYARVAGAIAVIGAVLYGADQTAEAIRNWTDANIGSVVNQLDEAQAETSQTR